MIDLFYLWVVLVTVLAILAIWTYFLWTGKDLDIDQLREVVEDERR